MLEERNLIYFTPFRFLDSNSSPKPKYLIVLKVNNLETVLVSLPTRRDNVPSSRDNVLGCLQFRQEFDGFDMVCFRIGPNDDFLENTKNPFHTDTHLYGPNLDLYPKNHFDQFAFEGIDYIVVGKVKQSVFKEILNCFRTNPSVKRGYRQLLSS